MPKRKREDEIEEEISQIENQALRIKVSRLKARFQNGVQQLASQLKLARGFDRQKMTRRMKQAGDDKSKTERLEAEIQVLKDIQEAKIARNHLLKQCSRTKRINEAPAFQALFGGDAQSKIKSPASVAESNVLGRLFKSNSVSEMLPEIMKGIRDVVGADKPANSVIKVEGSENAQTAREEGDGDDLFEGFSDAIDAGYEDRQINGSDMEAAYEDRLAESSNGEDSQVDEGLDPMQVTSDEDDDSEDLLGDDVDEEEYNEDDELLVQQKPSTKQKTDAKPLTTTSFLPSLMHGGYYSGSDSEEAGADYDPDKEFSGPAPVRKNRRGQRERQAIAEKKFGRRAKHLVKANGAEGVHGDRQRLISATTSKNDGWDARKGAVETNQPRPVKRPKDVKKAPNRFERRHGHAKEINGSAPRPIKPIDKPRPVKQHTEKLHPSWEAARKKKLQNAGLGETAFAGKKITFD